MLLKQATFTEEMIVLSEFDKDRKRIPPCSWSGFYLKNSQLLADFIISEFDSENTYVRD